MTYIRRDLPSCIVTFQNHILRKSKCGGQVSVVTVSVNGDDCTQKSSYLDDNISPASTESQPSQEDFLKVAQLL